MEKQFHLCLDKIDGFADKSGNFLHVVGKNFFKGLLFVVMVIIFGIATFVGRFGSSLIGKKD